MSRKFLAAAAAVLSLGTVALGASGASAHGSHHHGHGPWGGYNPYWSHGPRYVVGYPPAYGGCSYRRFVDYNGFEVVRKICY